MHTKLFSVCIHVRGPGQLGRYSDLLWDRIPVETRFSAPVQTGPGANLASYTIATGSFPGVKRPGRDVDHPPASSAEFKVVELLPLWAFAARSKVNFTFTLMHSCHCTIA